LTAKAKPATQASRNTSVRPPNWLDNTTSAPLTSTRVALISIVPEIPSCEVAETMLSATG
jgi:hypothetical protein